MRVRRATSNDIPEIVYIFEYAKQLQKKTGNPHQWRVDYPNRYIAEQDIENKNCYIIEDAGKTVGTFAFIIGDEPTYHSIRNGRWLNTEKYGTIHRLASNGTAKGLFSACFNWCCKQCKNIRIDTHDNNHIMTHNILKHGFIKCGIITVSDGTDRTAYQWIQA